MSEIGAKLSQELYFWKSTFQDFCWMQHTLDEWHEWMAPPIKGVSAAAVAAAKSLQSCLTLCDPIDGSPPGFPVPGILQARTLEWVIISFSNAWKWKVKVKWFSRVRLLATPWTAAYQAPLSMDFPGKSTGVGCHCLLWRESLPIGFCCQCSLSVTFQISLLSNRPSLDPIFDLKLYFYIYILAESDFSSTAFHFRYL